MKKDLDDTQDKLDEALQECREQAEAVMFLQEKTAAKKVQQNNSIRYVRRRQTNQMVGGGYGVVLAKQLVPMLEAVEMKYQPDAAKTDLDELTCWTADSNFAKKVALSMASSQFDKWIKSLVVALEDNPKWGGATAKCETTAETFDFIPKSAEVLHTTSAGVAPWAVACKSASLRYGPQRWPLPGIGAYVSTSSTIPTYIVAMKVEGLLSKGITLPDLPKFLESPSGAQFFKSATIISLSAGSVAWLPYGWVAWPLVLQPVEDKKESANPDTDSEEQAAGAQAADNKQASDVKLAPGTADSLPSFGFLWHCPVFSQSLASNLPTAVWHAISSYNMEHLTKLKGQQLWESRYQAMETFTKSMAGDE